MTNFEKVTASPEALSEFLADLPIAAGPWDECFHRIFCVSCAAENCDAENCPHNAERSNPLWWLSQAEPDDWSNHIVMWVKEYRKTMEELAGKIKEARSERVKATGDKSFTHIEALLAGLVEVLLPDKKCSVVMDYDPNAEEVTFSQLPARDIQAAEGEQTERRAVWRNERMELEPSAIITMEEPVRVLIRATSVSANDKMSENAEEKM